MMKTLSIYYQAHFEISFSNTSFQDFLHFPCYKLPWENSIDVHLWECRNIQTTHGSAECKTKHKKHYVTNLQSFYLVK